MELTFESNFTPIKQYQPTFRRPVQSVSDDEAEAEETKDYYNTLTMKLEQALDKISSSKKSVQGGNGFFERLVQFE